MARGYAWTVKEISILEENLGKIKMTEIHKMLPGRTLGACYTMATRIKETNDKFELRRKRKWTLKEINILVENQNLSYQELHKLLPNRHIGSIVVKCNELFKRRVPRNVWTKEEDQIIIDNCKKSIEELMELLPGRTENAIALRKYKLNAGIGRRKWTKEEDQIIIENPEMIPSQLKKSLPNRTINAIAIRKNYLQSVSMKRRRWTEEEDELIKNFYFDVPIEELMELLPNRSKSSIVARKCLLKVDNRLKGKTRWTDEEIEILTTFYQDTRTTELMELLPQHDRNSINTMANYYGLKKHNRVKWTKEKVDLLKNNYGKIDRRSLAKMIGCTPAALTVKCGLLNLK